MHRTCAPVAQAPELASPATPYTRAAFGTGWVDSDGDCLDTRAELLADLSTVPVTLAPSGCSVRHGRWIAPYTGQVVTEAGDLDIDHIVPLRYAWGHGADRWSAAKRARFALDPVNLLPVTASANRSTGCRPIKDSAASMCCGSGGSPRPMGWRSRPRKNGIWWR
ncbi:HNH endonuclease family protein [Rhodovulum sulfidophilum]|uniref:HNH endonuclease family protein n=1 Tax=Rhodovulum sulfidophilum TaxID=35806 RepID=UPI00095302FD|nr:HNH endonuclease family protein [Rhodovulum sulfidophilum]MBL3553827.1 HNH endonuclease [Rhodovulum sulfidophilum]OLS50190.1 hypothetical protein BV379_19145 [Rhodovulum sulfidophilum]